MVQQARYNTFSVLFGCVGLGFVPSVSTAEFESNQLLLLNPVLVQAPPRWRARSAAARGDVPPSTAKRPIKLCKTPFETPAL